MKVVEKVKLKLNYSVNSGEKTVKKSRTYSNISLEAEDDNLKVVGDEILALVNGENKLVYKVEESALM